MEKVNKVYIVGESRTNMDNAITKIYNSFYMAFEIDASTDKILDLGCTHTLDITERFIRELFVGKYMRQDNTIEEEIKKRYHGTSQKAVIVSYKDALKKYIAVKEKYFK
ncbi:MAG TPA: DUF3870 domain-containing protein [Tissierellia bacterium]|nr:DUF3870 domain-containing protein [Tissierellia bacterium]